MRLTSKVVYIGHPLEVVIPAHIRDRLNIKHGDLIEWEVIRKIQ